MLAYKKTPCIKQNDVIDQPAIRPAIHVVLLS